MDVSVGDPKRELIKQQIENNIKQKVKELRIKKGLSQEQLAQDSGIATVTVRALEYGKRIPSIWTLHCIANALDVSMQSIISPTDWKTPVSCEQTQYVVTPNRTLGACSNSCTNDK